MVALAPIHGLKALAYAWLGHNDIRYLPAPTGHLQDITNELKTKYDVDRHTGNEVQDHTNVHLRVLTNNLATAIHLLVGVAKTRVIPYPPFNLPQKSPPFYFPSALRLL